MLTGLNEFRESEGVLLHEGKHDFDYSDGPAVERYLEAVVENASDLSSTSTELESHIQDWATEYHLSSKRANLLRAFDLTGYKSALELGCGCGAVTRYLGEAGLNVDAVEGSPGRARIAAKRCRDLENVKVYCGNFNELKLPRHKYDLVCLVGVFEYAARFAGVQGSSDPAKALLDIIKPVLKPGGILLIAIENRTGMKYVMGAHEDHYARRYTGINGYFGEKDINTYSLVEWQRIFENVGVQSKKVFFPFPDYKLPTVLLGESFIEGNPHSFCHLEGVQSRDYVDLYRPAVRESLLWQSAAASNTLGAYANSFLLLCSFDEGASFNGFDLDFAHLPGFGRRRQYCLVTVKHEQDSTIRRHRLVDFPGESSSSESISQEVIQEPFHEGILLSVMWSRAIEIEPETGRFDDLVRDYISFLESREELSIDLTPFNIVVDNNGTYHSFDEEWISRDPVTVEFLLFRSLIMFFVKNGLALIAYSQKTRLETVEDFVLYVADKAGFDLSLKLEKFVEKEEEFQKSISTNREGGETQRLLKHSIREDERISLPVTWRLYWTDGTYFYSEENSRHVDVEASDEVQVARIRLPADTGKVKKFRFNPADALRLDGIGFMRIYRLEVFSIEPDTGKLTSIWKLNGGEEISTYTDMRGIEYTETDLGGVFMVTDDDPAIEFEMITRRRFEDPRYIQVEIEFRMPRSRDYLLAKDRYITNLDILHRKQNVLDEVLDSHHWIEEELRAIKASKFWKVFVRYRDLRKRMEPLNIKVHMWRDIFRTRGYLGTFNRFMEAVNKRLTMLVGREPWAPGPPTRYETWRDRRLSRIGSELQTQPLMSIVMPVYNVEGTILQRAIESVKNQTYKNWELCIADDASDCADTLRVLDDIKDERIRVIRLKENRNISGATNAAVDLASGEYLAFMDNDDELMETALQEIVRSVEKTGGDFLYTDEDFIRTDHHLDHPHFKPDYNPDLLLSHNYVTHLLVLKRSLFDKIGALRTERDGAQDYDLVLRAVENADKIVHVAKPLYHWRMSEKSTSLNPTVKPQGHNNAREALKDALQRRDIDATVEETTMPHYFRVKRTLKRTPRISIVIPFRDKAYLLNQCVNSILDKSTYQDYEIIGISNDSFSASTYSTMKDLKKLDKRVSFREVNEEFNFSRLVNYGVNEASGEHVILLNNDMDIITAEWLEGLLEHSQRPEIAAVGGKLYYPNNKIQHAGLAIGLGGYAGHIHKNARGDSPGYFNRLNVIQNVTAVTGAMMMVEKSKYRDLGGFDEVNFRVSYNDVDFCLRAMEKGYLNVFTPYVEAYHRESASRGQEDTTFKLKRFEREKRLLRERHEAIFNKGDPYYNPNLNQNRDDFSYAL